MQLLTIKPQLHKFDHFAEFAQEFQLGKGDLVFTHEFIYKPYMEALGLECDFLFQEHYGNGEPNSDMANKLLSDASNKHYDRVIAVGGGSVIDLGKILALKDITDSLALFQGKQPAIQDKQLIIVPTTCGTGSEVTNISVMMFNELGTKIGLTNDALFANHAVLIPELVTGLPYPFFLYSSLDALIHATESYVSPFASPASKMFSTAAIEMLLAGYLHILKNGPDSRLEVLDQFSLASTYAGIAFGNAKVGSVHALSYALGANYHVPHGESNYEFFVAVFKFYNEKKPEGAIQELNALFARLLDCDIHQVYDVLSKTLSGLIPVKPLREYGMKSEEISSFTDSVIENQERLLATSYVRPSREDILKIYQSLY